MGWQWKWAALALILTAGSAQADSGYVYARVHGGTAPTVDATYSLNPNGPITVTRSSQGVYNVAFASSGIGQGWAALATAVSPQIQGTYCDVEAWGADLVTVTCFGPGGSFTDANFTVLAVSNANDKGIGFAYAYQLTPATNYSPQSAYSYNPTNGTIVISHPSGKGAYQVVFNGMSGAGGTVQVVAYGTNAVCNSNGWSSASAVNVQCSDPSGNPLDAAFVIAIVPPATTPPGLAYAYVNSDGSSSANYNPTTLPTSTSRVGSGLYTVTFNGTASVPVSGGAVLATPDGSAARCSLSSITSGTQSFAVSVTVLCTDHAGNNADTAFELLVLPPMGYAYASVSAAGAVDAVDSVNPGGVPITATHEATGIYVVTFPNSGIGHGWVVHAFATGKTPNRCEVDVSDAEPLYGITSGAVAVICENLTGFTDTAFAVLAISTTNQSSLAFAYADQPSAGSYTANPLYSYNPAGSISITRNSRGNYSVVFHGLNGNGGNVQITMGLPVSAPTLPVAAECYPGAWALPDFTITVKCADVNGPEDYPFAITVVSAGATPAGLAYAWASVPSTSTSYTPVAAYSYNPSGSVTASRSAIGNYSLAFSGISLTGGFNQVTAYDAAAQCSPNVGSQPSLECFSTVGGTAADELYEVLVLAPIAGMPFLFNPPVGPPQSAPAGTQFANALVAVPVDYLFSPLNGTYVTFTAPSFGASGTFANGLTSVTVQTTGGKATAPAFTANSIQGSYVISATVASYPGATSPMPFLMTNAAPVLQSIAILPSNPSVSNGQEVAFLAKGSYSDGSTQDLTDSATWSSTNTSVATIGSTGVATTVVSSGTTTIKATLGSVSGSTTLTAVPPMLISIAVKPANVQLPKGETQGFTATATYSDNSTQDVTTSVTWASTVTSVATITSAGVATAVAASGTSNITANYVFVSSQATLTAQPPVLQSITVTPANSTVAKGLTQQFAATGHYSDGSQQTITGSVTWTSTFTSFATINGGGLATAVATSGTTTIQAISGAIIGSTSLTAAAPVLQSITVTPANPTVGKGLTQQFAATGHYSDGSQQTITGSVAWTSTFTSFATINDGGLATAVATSGTTTIQAISGAIIGSTSLTAAAPALQSITVTPANPTVGKGLTQQFTATGNYSDGSTQNLTGSVTWSANAPAGLATGSAVGQQTITATLGSVQGSTTLTVTAATLVSISLSPANPTIAKGLTKQFAATGTYSDNSMQNLTGQVTWSANAPAGLATGSAVGQQTIMASLGSVQGSTTLTVTAATLVSIAVTPANPTIVKGQTQQFVATGTYSDNSMQNLTGQVTWSANAPAGLATGSAVGQQTVMATLGSVQGSTTLTVTSASQCGPFTLSDLQRFLNAALGLGPSPADLDGDGTINVVDVQVVTNAVLGRGCTMP